MAGKAILRRPERIPIVKILTTLLKQDGGTAAVNGFDVAAKPDDVRQSISLTGQFAAVDEILTGRENLIMIARLRHLKYPRQVADDLLNRFGLIDAADRWVSTYSGGMRRRLDIAMSLVGNPQLIFLDEPTSGLDPEVRVEFWQIVKELADGGTTVFLTTQYLDEAEQLADRIAILHEGRIMLLAPGAAVKALVTSRIRLGLLQEWLLPVDGLPVPDPDETEVEVLRAFDAVRLFELRAQRVLPDFDAAAQAREVAALVRHVDGLPLAIELAAAWVRLLPVHEIRREIERSLDTLGDAGSGRAYSVRDSQEHSWRLLEPAERRAMMRLAVCRGCRLARGRARLGRGGAAGARGPGRQEPAARGHRRVAGRSSSFIGPAVYGFIAAEAALWYQAQGETVVTAEQLGQKMAILSIGVFLLVGLAMLAFVNEKKTR